MKYRSVLLWGCISAVGFGPAAIAAVGVDSLKNLYGYVTIGVMGICILLSGSLVNGDRLRANYHAEDAEARRKRNGFIGKLLVFASPYALIAAGLYAFA